MLIFEFLSPPSPKNCVNTCGCQKHKLGLAFCSELSPSLPALEAPRGAKLPCSGSPCSFLSHKASHLRLGTCCLHDGRGRPEQRVQDSLLTLAFLQAQLKRILKMKAFSVFECPKKSLMTMD